jgi:hypothetical protein
MKNRFGILWIIVLLLVIGCTGRTGTPFQAITATISPQSSNSITFQSSNIASPSVTPTRNLPGTITKTIIPKTQTPTPSNEDILSGRSHIRNQTDTPTPTESPTKISPTFIPLLTQIASFPAICKKIDPIYPSQSPSGNWLAISCGNIQNQTLEIVSKDGKRWILHFRDYLAKEFILNDYTPPGSLFPEFWTNDEEYLYFTPYISTDRGGNCYFGGYGNGVQGLYRIDVNTGTVSATLPTPSYSLSRGYEIAFSPGGRRLAYTSRLNNNLSRTAILDLKTGEELTVDIEDDIVGKLIWSPGGSELAYVTCRNAYDSLVSDKSAIKIYSLETHISKKILEVEENFLNIQSWDGNNLLRIAKYDLYTNETSYQFYDWSSGELTTPTPGNMDQ